MIIKKLGMKKTIVTIFAAFSFYIASGQQWTSWKSLDDGWEKNLKGRTEIINPYTGKFIQYEVKNDYKFLVFFLSLLNGILAKREDGSGFLNLAKPKTGYEKRLG